MIRLLALDECADTIVGNNLMRGVSGGQRKRVTTGEMVVG
jgi:ABC-type multidrug transport system ATPase subunit